MTKVSRQRKTTLAAQAAHTAAVAEAAVAEAAGTVQAAEVKTAEAPAPKPVAAHAPAAKAKAAKKQPAPAPAPAPAVATEKPAKAKPAKSKDKHATPPEAPKAKLVRDSFTMPKPEYEQLAQLKQRGTVLHRHVKKGELLRAGVAALAAMNDEAFLAALARVPSLKTGRPKSDAGAAPSAPAGRTEL